MPPPIETDALVIGAGPAGLFQVFELGLLGIAAHLVDTLPYPGGQCIELYPDKPIYDIPSVQVCTGRELVDRLLRQIAPFRVPMHLGQQVGELRRGADDGRFHVGTSAGTRFRAGAVVIAGGVGSFQPKRLGVDAVEPFDGTQLLHQRLPDAQQTAGRHVLVVGGDDPAVAAAIALAGHDAASRPASVTLLHRRDVLQAAAQPLAALQALRDGGVVAFVAGQVSGAQVDGAGRLGAVDVACADGSRRQLPCELLLVFLGLSPKLGPLAGWGLAMARKQLVVDTQRFETSLPGIFAVGDVNTYPGKRKLILSGFHEATLAAFAVAAHLHPERAAAPLQYTTTSPALHRRLGVAPD